jgi:hypothetical protein
VEKLNLRTKKCKESKPPTTPDSESKGEAKMQVLKPKTAIKKTKSSQKIYAVATTPDPKGEEQIEIVEAKEASMNTISSQRKMQKICEESTTLEPTCEAQVETVKPKAAIKLSNKTRTSKEGKNECEIDDLTKTERLLLEDNVVNTTNPNTRNKNGHVRDDNIELMKVKPDGEASTRASQTPRKKSAHKFFRKRA